MTRKSGEKKVGVNVCIVVSSRFLPLALHSAIGDESALTDLFHARLLRAGVSSLPGGPREWRYMLTVKVRIVWLWGFVS